MGIEQDAHGVMKPNEPNEKPIHYLSHKLTASQTNWPTIEKEAFAIFYAVQKLDQYLHSSEFVIRMDYKPLNHGFPSTEQNDSTLDHKHPWLQLQD